MIVKNEAPVIRRCLDSVRPFIDAWVIVDTGSTDGTQQIIEERLADLPGTLHARPWHNFGHNRSEALALARGRADYLLLLDADEQLEVPAGFVLPELVDEEYVVDSRFRDAADLCWKRATFIKSTLPWRYQGVVHEHLVLDGHRYVCAALPGPTIWSHFDGARNVDPVAKFTADARLLEAALVAEPSDTRCAFYLAQSYSDAGLLDEAIAAYQRRAGMGGFDEEVYFSMFETARLQEASRHAWPDVLAAYLRAYQFRPTRAEPLVAIARRYRTTQEWALAALFARAATSIPRPADVLFVDVGAYEWRAVDELAIASYYTGCIEEAVALNRRLLATTTLPPRERARIEANLGLCTERLTESS